MIGRCYPFSRHDAGERHAYAGRSVQPPRGSFTRQLLAEIAGEMVAVIREKVVRGSLILLRDFFDYVFNLVLGAESKALQQLATECTSRRFRAWLGPVYTRHSWSVMAAECVLSIQALNDDAGVQKGAANEPEGGGECAWLWPYVSAFRQIRLDSRRTGSRS